jgi:prepilin-type N-terminal cleavage/methylation domain-containing protein
MSRLIKREDGFTLIEVMVAALVLVAGAFASFALLRVAVVNTQRAKASQVALDRAQQEMEALRSLSNQELALTAAPPHSAVALNPDFRVNGSEFALVRSPVGNYKKLVLNGGELYGGGFISAGKVSPGPTPFTSGDVSGKVYRYVVWRNDTSCPESTCPGTQDYKQIVVAVKLDTPPNQTAEKGYVEVQSNFIDPKDSALNDPIPGAQGVNTAQQFYLSDTPCSPSGSTERQEITADHALHNTLGTCASGLHTGSTLGAPDTLLIGAPPDPAPEDPNNPLRYDYSVDYAGSPTPETAKGIQLRRDDTGGCHYVPAGTSAPHWQVHRWVTDPMKAEFKLTEKVTLDIATRTLSDASYKGTLCIYLFVRHETGSPPTATDTMLVDKKSSLPYWSYTPSGTGQWHRGIWFELRQELTFAGPISIPVGDRLGLALSVERSGTGGDALAFLYDHPNHRSRIEIDTTTPLSGE